MCWALIGLKRVRSVLLEGVVFLLFILFTIDYIRMRICQGELISFFCLSMLCTCGSVVEIKYFIFSMGHMTCLCFTYLLMPTS